jgi:GT2 family glycosyltransferase
MDPVVKPSTRIRGPRPPAMRPREPSLRQRRDRSAAGLRFSAVIPTKDRQARALSAVVGLMRQIRPPERIVVVDASERPLSFPAELRERARRAGIELILVHSEASTSAQRNRGVQRVRTPLVLLVDDDVTLEPDYSQVLLERWECDGLGAIGALVGVPLNVSSQHRTSRLLRRALMLHYQAIRAKSTSFRRSRKLRLVSVPAAEVSVPACGAGYGLFRADLLRRHPFDERFAGYAPGEDLDMSTRLSRDAPILQIPTARWTHDFSPHEQVTAARWRQRGRIETYFRARHLERSPLSVAAFAMSLIAEAAIATAYSLRHRGAHLFAYLAGVLEMLRERDFRYAPEPQPVSSADHRTRDDRAALV